MGEKVVSTQAGEQKTSYAEPNQPLMDQRSPILMEVRHRIVDTPLDVMIADEDKLFIEGISAMVRQWEEFRLVGVAASVDEVLTCVAERRPTIVLMGVCIQGVMCSEIIRTINERGYHPYIVAIASKNEAASILDALRSGVSGYGVREDITGDRLRGYLWGVAAGEIIFTGSAAPLLREELMKQAAVSKPDYSVFDTLSKREREVLALLVEGLSNHEIGARLYLSEPTVKKLVGRVTEKLQVTNRVQAAVLATKYMLGER